MIDNSNMGEKITELRAIKKMKQKELADLLGISPSVLSDYEHNRVKPTLKILNSLCNIFNVQMDFFFAMQGCTLRQNVKDISDEATEYLIPICSFEQDGENIDLIPIGSEPAPGYIPDDPETYFYLNSSDGLQLFQFFHFAEYLDEVLAFNEKSSEPGIFKAAEKDGRICFVKDGITYEQNELDIIAVPFLPIVFRKYIIE